MSNFVGSLLARLGLDNTQYETGLDNARASAAKFGDDIKGTLTGAFTFGAILSGFNALTSKFDRVDKLAKRLSVTMEEVQRVGEVGELSGIGLEPLLNILTRLNRRVGEQLTGLADYSKAMNVLGISAEEFVNLGLDGQLILLSKAFNESQNDGAALAGLMKLLDTEARDLIPLLQEGPEKLQQMFNDASVASDKSIQAIVRLNDNITKLKSSLAAGLAPIVEFFDARIRKLALALAAIRILGEAAFEAIRGNGERAKQITDALLKRVREFQEELEGAPRS
jgi:hypothetical protein